MGNTPQQRTTSWIRLIATNAAVVFGIALVLTPVITQSAQAQALKVLYNFKGLSDGADPYATLILDNTGNLYGTANYGGTSLAGTVFKVASTGAETVLYTFTGKADGAYPFSALVRDQAGNLYGTTSQGGSANSGVVFQVDPSGTETVLHNFTGGTDGVFPLGGLLRDKAGNLYGTTSEGGTFNDGVLFKIDPAGQETILHTFSESITDGKYPTFTSLLMDAQGTIYGVTQQGGAKDGGILYKWSSGKLTILHSFRGGTTDGCNVLGTPFMDTAGNFYGTTASCGTFTLGTVWKVKKNGTESILHSFAGGSADGEYPFAGVIVDATGNLYGNTENGGPLDFGTVFEISSAGKFSLMHLFDGADGKYPFGSFVQNAKGTLFGTAQNGGTGGYGTLWKITK